MPSGASPLVRILVTGNMGYVGPAVVRRLRASYPHAELIGFDTGFFAHCLTDAARLPEVLLSRQVFGDIREIDRDLLSGCDAVVHLAAISNDPMGDSFAEVTRAINQDASVRLAEIAAGAGVKSFVFASSCSVYGVAEGPPRREGDPLNPVTAYARSKIGTEQALERLAGAMTITCLRFATACGMSDRLRLDLVLNDFVASALTGGNIVVLSDGTPWRPLIDTADMALAIEWAAARPAETGGAFLCVNAGSPDANYQVRQLAERVAAIIPGTRVSINHAAPADSRSYRVDFSRFATLAPGHLPRVSLDQSIRQLARGIAAGGITGPEVRKSPLVRLNALRDHLAAGRLNEKLRWSMAERES